jgi:hypothetical protein
MPSRRPSATTVIACLALFIAIGGTAAALPGRNTVNSGDVKNETLRSSDLKNEAAVQSPDVVDDTLQSQDVAPGALQSNDYDTGSVTGAAIGTNAVQEEEIGANSVGTSEITFVETGDLQTGAVTSAKIGPNAVGSFQLAHILTAEDPTPYDFGDQDEGNNDYLYGESIAACPAGSTVIAGGAEFVGSTGNGGVGGDELQAITESRMSSNGWFATAVSDVDNQDFAAIAYCLSTGL